ncbi:MAG: DUF6338 family protein [Humibacillus sp.]|nr:DUF6338 family protein [Humibacillus sp.]
MIPSTIGAVFSFFLFVAPGLLFDLLAARRRAGVPESAFREVSRVVLASTAFTAVAAAIVVLLGLAVPPARARLMNWSSGGESLSATEPSVLIAMIAVASLACVLACLVHAFLARGVSQLHQTSAWSHVFRTEAPAGSAPYARVKTSSGSTYTGFVGTYTPDLDAAGRELVLVPPLWSAAPGKSLNPVEQWSRIVLRADEIVVLMVDYRPDPTQLEEGHGE